MPPKNHNATPSITGWHFQYNAAIVILLNNIEDAQSVKIEGNREDIEIRLSDGRTIFAQAKSTGNPMDSRNALRDLSKALETLTEANHSAKTKELIFATNRTDPFCEESTRQQFSGPYIFVPYTDLWKLCQDRIIHYCKTKGLDLPLNKLFILVLYFSGNTDNRYRAVKERIRIFLSKLHLSNRGWEDKAFERWMFDFAENSTEHDHSKELSKESIVWPLIAWLCDETTDISQLEEQYDDATVELITNTFKNVINEKTERFEFVTKVTGAYEHFKKLHGDLNSRDALNQFLSEQCEGFMDEFDFHSVNDDDAKAVVKQTLKIILKQQRNITSIKNAVKL